MFVSLPVSSSILASEESHARMRKRAVKLQGAFLSPAFASPLLCLLLMISPRQKVSLRASFLLTFIFSFQLPAAIGEAPTFGFTEHMANKFFKPEGVRSLTITYMTVAFYLFWQPKYFCVISVVVIYLFITLV